MEDPLNQSLTSENRAFLAEYLSKERRKMFDQIEQHYLFVDGVLLGIFGGFAAQSLFEFSRGVSFPFFEWTIPINGVFALLTVMGLIYFWKKYTQKIGSMKSTIDVTSKVVEDLRKFPHPKHLKKE